MFCHQLDRTPVLKGFLEGFLPTLALVIFMAVLPMIMRGKYKCTHALVS